MADTPVQRPAIGIASPASDKKEDPIVSAHARQILMAPIIVGEVTMASPETQTTVGSAGGATALPATPTGYIRMMFGSTEYVIPYYAQS